MVGVSAFNFLLEGGGRLRVTIATVTVLLCAATAFAETSELTAPKRIEASGKPIDVDIGHAAPFVGDFDGDGKHDLLVGQFGQGKLRIFRNLGSNKNPKFEDFTWFQASDGDGKVPSG